MAEAAPPGGEVVIHSSEQIHTLLIGTHQLIGTAADQECLEDQNKNDVVDFSRFRFPDPIEPTKVVVAEPSQSSTSQRRQSVTKVYTALRRDEPQRDALRDYLSVYETNNHRKMMMLHQEVEDHFLQPLSRRLAHKTSGAPYARFIDRRSRAVSVFDTRTQLRDSFLEPLPEIPVLHCDTSDLTDPIKKYRRQAQRENDLVEFIGRSTGQWVEPPEVPECDTMNLKRWKILAETRFYTGKSDKPVAQGKRMLPSMFRSSVGAELNQFDPPEPKTIRVRKSVPPASVDHVGSTLSGATDDIDG
jgi:hypothetical protein